MTMTTPIIKVSQQRAQQLRNLLLACVCTGLFALSLSACTGPEHPAPTAGNTSTPATATADHLTKLDANKAQSIEATDTATDVSSTDELTATEEVSEYNSEEPAEQPAETADASVRSTDGSIGGGANTPHSNESGNRNASTGSQAQSNQGSSNTRSNTDSRPSGSGTSGSGSANSSSPGTNSGTPNSSDNRAPNNNTTRPPTQNPPAQTPAPQTITVTIEISARTAHAADPAAVAGLSSNGVILARRTLNLPVDATVRQALDATGVRLNARGAYIAGIGGLNERDLGPRSGWLYSVNGQFPAMSASIFRLSTGDTIVWHYTVNGGGDVGAPTW